MNLRPASVLLFLIFLVSLGLGAFLLYAAEETPAPGVFLLVISGAALLLLRRTGGVVAGAAAADHDDDDDDSPFAGLDEARKSYDPEAERQRRGDDLDQYR